ARPVLNVAVLGRLAGLGPLAAAVPLRRLADRPGVAGAVPDVRDLALGIRAERARRQRAAVVRLGVPAGAVIRLLAGAEVVVAAAGVERTVVRELPPAEPVRPEGEIIGLRRRRVGVRRAGVNLHVGLGHHGLVDRLVGPLGVVGNVGLRVGNVPVKTIVRPGL